jgi:thiamine biosynthesis lipoprotein ApbE
MRTKNKTAKQVLNLMIGAGLLAVCFLGLRSLNTEKPKVFTAGFENVLGTSFDLKTYAISEKTADQAEKIALEEIDRLSAILSSYDNKSEFSQWQQSNKKAIGVSPELFEAMELFDHWKLTTKGALDPAAGAIVKLWQQAEKANEFPTEAAIEKVKKEINQQHWALDKTNYTAAHLSSTPLLFNSFLKSYIIEKVADKVMGLEGIHGVVVNIGGDVITKGSFMETINIVDPQADAENNGSSGLLKLSNKAIATSGNYRRGFSIKGHQFSHIVDPRSGKPVETIASATVISDKATDAGALATAFNILRPEESKALADRFNAAYQIIFTSGKKIENAEWTSLNIDEHSTPANNKKTASAPRFKNWNKDYEVSINLELMRFEGRTRRPFVAIWVENAQQKTVRTIALWYNKPRWLPDLKEWYRKNQADYKPGLKDMNTISSATRPAGNYTIKWDGKNDDGEYINADNYTICIELAREHGTYQIIKQEVACKSKAGEYTLQGNAEVKAASIEYKKNSKPQ